jgi:HPt (histidine-containing phosphotransfer) domain-containing protein
VNIDRTAALSHVDGDEELLAELIALFRTDTPCRMAHLHMALQAGDLTVGEREAHSLKSAAAYIGASAVSSVAAAIEDAARREDVHGALSLYISLTHAYQRLQDSFDLPLSA